MDAAALSVTAPSLDRPVWHALAGRRAALARGDGRARRLDPAVGPFAAAADASAASRRALAALVAPGETIALIEPDGWPIPSGFDIVRQAALVQMVATQAPAGAEGDLAASRSAARIEPLDPRDAEAMLALATETRPGPFLAGTHRFGGFVGIRDGGRLAAMAGTRLALGEAGAGFVEVSGVCTHPDHRGRGYAAALIAHVVAAIAAAGDRAFLTSYVDNAGAIALYRRLGFAVRREMTLTLLARGDD